VTAEIHRREKTEELELVNVTDDADVELAIIDLGAGAICIPPP
jgi:hypothetical protein